MRSTRAASAIERLNNRTESREYSMLRTSDERFILTRRVAGQPIDLAGPLIRGGCVAAN